MVREVRLEVTSPYEESLEVGAVQYSVHSQQDPFKLLLPTGHQ